jgi:uncharacterized iron-regulated membrane protein
MTVRSAVVATHRWMGLIAAALWMLQAATGVLIVFHWEIDDAITAGSHHSTDWSAIEQRVRDFKPDSMWTTAGAADRYDVTAGDRVIRIDGAGNVLRTRRDDEKFANGGIVDTIVVLHQSLLADDSGKLIIGTSGALLVSNMVFGLIAAWPRRKQWRRALTPLKTGSRIARLYSWHRALGLSLAVLAMCFILAGVTLAFFEFDPPVVRQPGAVNVGLTSAVRAALDRYPAAAVSGIRFPNSENAVWMITLNQPHELQRAYGKTRVFVSATDGRILGTYDALRVSGLRRLEDLLFPIHTGEIGGIAGRLLVMAMGCWLLTMIVLGLSLWWARRKSVVRPRAHERVESLVD